MSLAIHLRAKREGTESVTRPKLLPAAVGEPIHPRAGLVAVGGDAGLVATAHTVARLHGQATAQRRLLCHLGLKPLLSILELGNGERADQVGASAGVPGDAVHLLESLGEAGAFGGAGTGVEQVLSKFPLGLAHGSVWIAEVGRWVEALAAGGALRFNSWTTDAVTSAATSALQTEQVAGSGFEFWST